MYKQFKGYKEIFRDGQDTTRRNFTFEKLCEIDYEDTKKIEFQVKLVISNENRPEFTITTSCDNNKLLESFDLSFFKEVYDKLDVQETKKNSDEDKISYEITDKSE